MAEDAQLGYWPRPSPARLGTPLFIDGDEHVVGPLAVQMADAVTGGSGLQRPDGGQAFWINRRFIFHGRWVRYGMYYPACNLSLFKHALSRFEHLT